jgi:hypothetical protein
MVDSYDFVPALVLLDYQGEALVHVSIGSGLRGDVRWERPVEFFERLVCMRVRDRVAGVHAATVEFGTRVLGFPIGAIGLVTGGKFRASFSPFCQQDAYSYSLLCNSFAIK